MGKPVPSYWSDFEWQGNKMISVIVESDYDEFPVVSRLPLSGKTCECGSAKEYCQAIDLIDDLKAGRKDPRKLAALVTAS